MSDARLRVNFRWERDAYGYEDERVLLGEGRWQEAVLDDEVEHDCGCRSLIYVLEECGGPVDVIAAPCRNRDRAGWSMDFYCETRGLGVVPAPFRVEPLPA